jgi:hypothetical protein
MPTPAVLLSLAGYGMVWGVQPNNPGAEPSMDSNDRKEEQYPSGSGQPGAQPEQGRNGEQNQEENTVGEHPDAFEQPAEEQNPSNVDTDQFSTD